MLGNNISLHQQDYLASLTLTIKLDDKYKKIKKIKFIRECGCLHTTFKYTLNKQEYIIKVGNELSGEEAYKFIMSKLDIRLMMVDN